MVFRDHDASRRSFLKWSAAAPLSLSTLGSAHGAAQAPSSIVVDAACPLVHPGRGEKAFSEYLDQMLRGGVGLALGTVASIESFEETLSTINAYYSLFEKFRDRVLHAKSLDDVRRAKTERKVAVVFHFQGSGMLDYELSRLTLFKELGVRVIQLASWWETAARRGPIADSPTLDVWS
jgi:membrane dipeptidase